MNKETQYAMLNYIYKKAELEEANYILNYTGTKNKIASLLYKYGGQSAKQRRNARKGKAKETADRKAQSQADKKRNALSTTTQIKKYKYAPVTPTLNEYEASPIDTRATSSPLTPAKPSAPQTPAKPSAPQTPAKPSAQQEPAKPSAPQTPAKPSAQQEPAKPSAPQEPAKPSAPDEPAKPKEKEKEKEKGWGGTIGAVAGGAAGFGAGHYLGNAILGEKKDDESTGKNLLRHALRLGGAAAGGYGGYKLMQPKKGSYNVIKHYLCKRAAAENPYISKEDAASFIDMVPLTYRDNARKLYERSGQIIEDIQKPGQIYGINSSMSAKAPAAILEKGTSNLQTAGHIGLGLGGGVLGGALGHHTGNLILGKAKEDEKGIKKIIRYGLTGLGGAAGAGAGLYAGGKMLPRTRLIKTDILLPSISAPPTTKKGSYNVIKHYLCKRAEEEEQKPGEINRAAQTIGHTGLMLAGTAGGAALGKQIGNSVLGPEDDNEAKKNYNKMLVRKTIEGTTAVGGGVAGLYAGNHVFKGSNLNTKKSSWNPLSWFKSKQPETPKKQASIYSNQISNLPKDRVNDINNKGTSNLATAGHIGLAAGGGLAGGAAGNFLGNTILGKKTDDEWKTNKLKSIARLALTSGGAIAGGAAGLHYGGKMLPTSRIISNVGVLKPRAKSGSYKQNILRKLVAKELVY